MTRSTRSGGFATVLAVSMVALVGMMLVLLMAELRDVKRESGEARVEAELGQLLLAGAAAAGKLVAEPAEALQVKLPASLEERGASLNLRNEPTQSTDLEKRVRVEASIQGRTARQTLRFVKSDLGWGLIEAKLE